ncbi:protein translocase subunit SECA2, chloroplastic-like isoform X2 [Hevea brasiliensis]|uniref:protein translocase subunit SECA2, chloroplastic-like isoform X2 n=1 Tax=Hevea brasiliensis TaxID=3981 RepID=UPI0025FC3E9E|nr:protein translocase subunit SECA2, chloroplastic-like isoform X2 [Hevea brasiliensis]
MHTESRTKNQSNLASAYQRTRTDTENRRKINEYIMATVPALLNPSFLAPKPPNRHSICYTKPIFIFPTSSAHSPLSLSRFQRCYFSVNMAITASLKENLGNLRKRATDFTSLNYWVVRDYYRLVESVNAIEPQIQKLSDEQLSAKTVEFRRRLRQGETLADIQAEAFTVVREAARRKLGMRHFDVQCSMMDQLLR